MYKWKRFWCCRGGFINLGDRGFLSDPESKSRLWLNIFLDSFDECLLRIETLGALIKDGINNIPIERLSLRIACRTADWLTSLESDFKMVWGENNVSVFELAPLRRQDVGIAASTFGCDAESFIKEVIER